MLISDLNYLEVADKEADVIGGSTMPGRFFSNTNVGSTATLTSMIHLAAAEADAAAAPASIQGSSFTQIRTFTAAGILRFDVGGGLVGSVSSSTSLSAAD